jgi:hypothetical protein
MRSIALLCFFGLFVVSTAAPITPILRNAWANGILDFTFPTQADRDYYLQQKLYLSCIPNGLKMGPNGDVFVSIRRGGNCPVTFAKMLPNYQLQPYPSWEANGGVPSHDTPPTPWRQDPGKLQSVLGFEIDPCNRVWILDQGISGPNPAPVDGAKLLVYDLDNDNLLRRHNFPPTVVIRDNSFLDDVSVDLVHNFLYITDAGVPSGVYPTGGLFSNNTRGGIIVYDIKKDLSWRILDGHMSVQPDPFPFYPEAAGEKIGKNDRVNIGADGAGLTADANTFYYTALTSQRIWRIPTAVLRASQGMQVPQIAADVTLVVAATGSIAGGILSSNDGSLYLTDLTNSAVKRLVELPSNEPCTAEGCPASTIMLDSIATDPRMQWPDGLGFTINGSLILFANQLQHVINGEPVTEFTLWELPLNERNGVSGSYMQNWVSMCDTNDPFANPPDTDTSCDRDGAFWGMLAWAIVATLLCIVLAIYARKRHQGRRDGSLLGY